MISVSIVSPVYEAENIINELVRRVEKEIKKITNDYELILVDDGSTDSSWKQIELLCEKNSNLKGIKLSKNFGQAYAISAGLKVSKKKVAIVLDCDLQEDPKYFHQLIEEHIKGYHIVLSIAKKRKHSFFKNVASKLFYSFLNILNDNTKISQNGTLSLISRDVIDAFLKINDYHRHYLAIIKWLGFSKTSIVIEHDERYSGESTYSINKLITLALNGLTSQTDRLLKISIYIGCLFSLFGFFSIIYIIVQYFISGYQTGWPSIVILIIFSTGLILISLGILGLYISKIFEQTKERPLYIIEKHLNKH
ncbi:MAG: glycosyltransferase [Candidatus Marinimicrobia bacterium]|nr:glycosyltransferase [Candidatus Neomarinimicrobiota bacterium]